jgi:hypothetical protein
MFFCLYWSWAENPYTYHCHVWLVTVFPHKVQLEIILLVTKSPKPNTLGWTSFLS